jgi:hypothetical protein
MAKKKAPAAPIQSDPDDDTKKNLIVIRGYVRWGKWAERLAKRKRIPVVALIDQLMAEEAERIGFESPPKRY